VEADAYAPARAKADGMLAIADNALVALSWVTGIATVYYKTLNGREAYLLQVRRAGYQGALCRAPCFCSSMGWRE
jgi:hypothetical protein